MNIHVCHLLFNGTRVKHSSSSLVWMLDDAAMTTLRPYGHPRGDWSATVQPGHTKDNIAEWCRSSGHDIDGGTVPPGTIALLNFERLDNWHHPNAAEHAKTIRSILIDAGFAAVYAYGYWALGLPVMEHLDGVMVSHNRAESWLPAGAIPILHLKEWGSNSTADRVRELTDLGIESAVVWMFSGDQYESIDAQKAAWLRGYADGYAATKEEK